MVGEQRLLAHLTRRFTTQHEDIATEALGFILQQSDGARAAFVQLLSDLVPALVPPVLFRTQVADESLARPDVVGYDALERTSVMIEAKFWAGLTSNQPVGYLDRLQSNGLGTRVLFVIAPRRRLNSLWSELLRLCADSPQYGGPHEVELRDEARVVGLAQGTWMAQTTWDHVLNRLLESAEVEGDAALKSDLMQLKGLADVEDADAFAPMEAALLVDQRIPKLVIDLRLLLDELVARAVAAGLLNRKGAREPRGNGVEAKYVRFGYLGALIEISHEHWRSTLPTPLWIRLQQWRDPASQGLSLAEARTRLRDLEVSSPSKMLPRPDGTELWIPLNIPPGAEREEVLDSLLGQIRHVSECLGMIGVIPD